MTNLIYGYRPIDLDMKPIDFVRCNVDVIFNDCGNKHSDIKELKDATLQRKHDYIVCEIILLSNNDYLKFCDNFLVDYPFIVNFNECFSGGGEILAIADIETKEFLLVDPSGSKYARYVSFSDNEDIKKEINKHLDLFVVTNKDILNSFFALIKPILTDITVIDLKRCLKNDLDYFTQRLINRQVDYFFIKTAPKDYLMTGDNLNKAFGFATEKRMYPNNLSLRTLACFHLDKVLSQKVEALGLEIAYYLNQLTGCSY